MATLAGALDDACGQRAFDDLILVASRRSQGELRGLLSKRVQVSVRHEVAKDLTNQPASLLRSLALSKGRRSASHRQAAPANAERQCMVDPAQRGRNLDPCGDGR